MPDDKKSAVAQPTVTKETVKREEKKEIVRDEEGKVKEEKVERKEEVIKEDAPKPAEAAKDDDKKEAAENKDAKKDAATPKTDEKKPPPAISPAPLGASGNKAGEPPFQLKIEPNDRLVFRHDKLGTDNTVTIELKLKNITNKRQTFKIKCTSNEIFRVRPPLAFIEPNETFTLRITFTARELTDVTKHYFAVYHMAVDEKATAAKTPARALWTSGAKFDGVKRLQCVFTKADGSPWNGSATAAASAPAPAAAV